uniref:Uncharacterized protein n=1 Tax=Arundo donax TaxID=35708 RepID=A0A0A8XW96_ARUDO
MIFLSWSCFSRTPGEAPSKFKLQLVWTSQNIAVSPFLQSLVELNIRWRIHVNLFFGN